MIDRMSLSVPPHNFSSVICDIDWFPQQQTPNPVALFTCNLPHRQQLLRLLGSNKQKLPLLAISRLNYPINNTKWPPRVLPLVSRRSRASRSWSCLAKNQAMNLHVENKGKTVKP